MSTPPARRVIGVVLLAWVAWLGFDFLLHAGLLAKLWVEPHPFLLPHSELFRLIPLGYLSFLAMVILVAWLMIWMHVRGGGNGAVFGLKFGLLISASMILGLASISTARPALLIAWFVTQSLETSLAGAVIGAGFAAQRLRWLVLAVCAFVLFSVVIAVAMQNLGLAPMAPESP